MVQNVFVLESYLKNNRGVRSNYKFWGFAGPPHSLTSLVCRRHRLHFFMNIRASEMHGKGGGKQEPGRVVSRGWVINGALVLRARNGRDHWRIARSSCGHDFVTRTRSPTYLNTLIIVYKKDWLFYDLVFFF